MAKVSNIWRKCYKKRLSLSEAEWQIGHSEIFLRSELVSKLEVLAKLEQLVAARGMGKNLDTRLLACKQAGYCLC